METLTAGNHEMAIEIAGAPDAIRGYEEIKMRNAAKVRERVSELLPRLAEADGRGSSRCPRGRRGRVPDGGLRGRAPERVRAGGASVVGEPHGVG